MLTAFFAAASLAAQLSTVQAESRGLSTKISGLQCSLDDAHEIANKQQTEIAALSESEARLMATTQQQSEQIARQTARMREQDAAIAAFTKTISEQQSELAERARHIEENERLAAQSEEEAIELSRQLTEAREQVSSLIMVRVCLCSWHNSAVCFSCYFDLLRFVASIFSAPLFCSCHRFCGVIFGTVFVWLVYLLLHLFVSATLTLVFVVLLSLPPSWVRS